MDWNTGNNPWAPGGRMASRAPWGQKAIEQGWAKAGPYFTPKSDAQIRKEALIQLAVIAAVVAAPALVGAAGGASAGSGAAAAGTALPATTMVEGASVIAAQVAPAAAAGAAGGAGMAALLPFAVGGALSGLQAAAQQGSGALNSLLHRLAPTQRPRLSPGGAEGQAAGDESLQHPGMQLVERLAGQIGKSKVLELALRRAMGSGNVQGLAMQPSLMQVVREAVAGVREVNVWEGGSRAPQIRNEAYGISTGLEFDSREFSNWFWASYYPAMSPIDQTQIDNLHSANFPIRISFGVPTDNNAGGSTFDFDKKSFAIQISSEFEDMKSPEGGIDYKQVVPVLGDELQHAYQFLKGEIGYLKVNNNGDLDSVVVRYDLDDELESLEGALRATENYLLFHYLTSDQQKSDFFNTREGRKAGFAIIDAVGENRAMNQIIGYYARVKNPFKDKSELIAATKYLRDSGYTSRYFYFGFDRAGKKSTVESLWSKFPIGGRPFADMLIVGQAYCVSGILKVILAQ